MNASAPDPASSGPAASDDPRPKILIAVSRMSTGGVQQVILETLARADRGRFRYEILCTKKAGNLAPQAEAAGVPVHVQKTLPPWDPYQIVRLSRMIRRLRPDLIHVHMSQMVIPAVSAGLLAGTRKFIVQHHNLYDEYWATRPAPLRAWERRLTLRADRIIAVSQAVADCTADRLGIPAGRIEVVYNGIDLDRFRDVRVKDPRAEWGLAPGTPLVVQVSRISPYKRVEDFVEAAAVCLERIPDPAVPPAFVLVGSGPEPLTREIKALIRDRGLEGRFILAGSRSDVAEILPACDVAVLSSEREGFGLVLLEYRAAGLPVAATDIPTTRELTAGDPEVVVSPPRDPAALSANILALLDARPRRAARPRASGILDPDRFRWDRAAREYERIYAEALGLGSA